MPIWLRRFTFKKMQEHYEKQGKSSDDLATQTQKIKEGKIDLPSHFKGKLDPGKRIAKY